MILPLSNKEKNMYIVKKGDSLYKIANMYETTIEEIIKLNNLSNTSLSIGQVLEIPLAKGVLSTNYYIVQKGDTLYSIAKQNNINVEEIIKLNNLENNIISIGQKIKIKNL